MEKKVLLKELVDTGTNLRKQIISKVRVSDEGVYPIGELWDANTTLDIIVNGAHEQHDTIKELDTFAHQIDTDLKNEINRAKAAEQDLDNRKANKVDVYTKDEVYNKQEIDDKGFLTQHQDISGKADQSDLDSLEESISINGVLGTTITSAERSAWNAKVDSSSVGVANGVATLNENGIIPSSQLPSYVDDVLEYESSAEFPVAGESGKIYIDLLTNKTYRWGGSGYVEISESLALGETSSTAYAGNKGKATTDAFNAHATNTDIHVTAAKQAAWDAKADVSYVEDNYLKNYIEIDPTGGHDYVEIGGVKWATVNIGAESITDTGLYFQWGDTQGYTADQVGRDEGQKPFNLEDYKYFDGTSFTMVKYNSTDGKTVLEASDDAVIANWGGSWRMPTTAEFQALGTATTSAWTTDYQGSGVAGLVLTSKSDSSKKLFFPAAGYCFNGSVNGVGSGGHYWSSSLNSSNVLTAYYLFFYSGNVDWRQNNRRHYGLPVRGVYVGPEPQQVSVSGVTDTEKTSWNNKSDFSGSYNDLTDKPTIPTVAQSDWNQSDSTAIDYIKNKPDIDLITSRVRKTDFDLADLKAAVADGNLEKYGLKVGDQKTINGHTYVIAGLNPMKGTNDYRVNKNHVGLIVLPHTTTKWNASGNTSAGADERGAGYLNSDLHYYLKNTVLPMCNTDLGADNLISHNKLLSNAVNTTGYNRRGEASGCSSGWAWEDTKICALSEVQVYGGTVWSSSGFDTGEACRQLDVFQKYSYTEIFGDEYPWLRDVVSATLAALAHNAGTAGNSTASYALYVAALILFH